MIAVNNRKNSLTPLPFFVKKKKMKSQNVTPTLPKSHGPEASGALSKKRKKTKSKNTTPETQVTPPSVPTEDSEKTQSVSSRQTAHLKDIEGNIQPAVKGSNSPPDEGTHQSQSFPKGNKPDPQDSEGNIHLVDMGLPAIVPDEGVGKTLSPSKGTKTRDKDPRITKPLPDIEPSTPHVTALSGANTEDQADQTQSAKFSNDDVFEAGDEMDEDIQQADNEETQSPNLFKDASTKEPVAEDHLEKHEEVAASYADLKCSLEDFIHTSFTKILDNLKEVQDVVKEDPALNKKVLEATEAYTRNSSSFTELLSLVKSFDFPGLKSAIENLQATSLKQDEKLCSMRQIINFHVMESWF
ncbi:hypothetical protein Tco_0618777 [Tanacetum coccineum]